MDGLGASPLPVTSLRSDALDGEVYIHLALFTFADTREAAANPAAAVGLCGQQQQQQLLQRLQQLQQQQQQAVVVLFVLHLQIH
ncbi:hypothetical protein EBH_0013300 [Eimeria brunetti]|uniref:Uncharacterized protein n=1 Tax=Eimeria brunetti TaxID=51314 RepID=U6LDV2_9EIME|nr:hypothetical protein EBH_0013300 [Eimeria brunetti]